MPTPTQQLQLDFPELFIDGALCPQRLLEHLRAQEDYGLRWPGKSRAVAAGNSAAQGQLAELPELGVNAATSPHLLIEGDNLDVLKLLERDHSEQVDLIYIDPPYNTGNTFVYDDNFRVSMSQFQQQTGRKSRKTDPGRVHSSWLNMMLPRLMVARRLMKPSAVGFISLDANELTNCRMLLSEVFGEDNVLQTLVWVSNLKGRQIGKGGPAVTHEYILCFAKDASQISWFRSTLTELSGHMPTLYKPSRYAVKHDELGPYVTKNELYNTNSKFNEQSAPTMVYRIHHNFDSGETRTTDIDSTESFEGFTLIMPHRNARPDRSYHAWRWGRKRVEADQHGLEFVIRKGSPRIYTKIRDIDGVTMKDLIIGPATVSGQADLRALGMKLDFDTPKPVALLDILLGAAAPTDAVVLDFFAGSGTTGHAVVARNAADGGDRRYIMVQLPVPIEHPEFATLADITRERMRRVHEGAGDTLDAAGFRLLRWRA